MFFRKSNYVGQLASLLDEAVAVSSKYTGGYNYEFSGAEHFHDALKESTTKLKEGDRNQLTHIKRWFETSSAWDEFVGHDGQHIANAIEGIVYKIVK